MPAYSVWSGRWGLGGASIDRALSVLTELERLGYEQLWVPEAFGREAIAFAAIALSSTNSLSVGTSVANMHARDAVAAANAAKTLSEAFEGRFSMGLGVSHPELSAVRGYSDESPLAAARSYRTRMAEAPWIGSEVRFPPIFLGALGPRMLEMAGTVYDGAHTYLCTPSHTRNAREVMGPEPVLVVELTVLAASTTPGVLDLGREFLSQYLALDTYRRSLIRQGFSDSDVSNASERLLRALLVPEDPSAVGDSVAEHLEAGANQVAIQVVGRSEGDELRVLRDAFDVLCDIAQPSDLER